MNYSEHLDAGGNDLPSKLSKRNDGSSRYLCPSCSGYRPASTIINTASVPNAPSDWACSVCWSDWRRKLLAMTDGDDALVKPEWDHLFLTAAGGHDTSHLMPVIKNALARAKAKAAADGKDTAKIQGRLNAYNN